ncbi:RNA-binding S4 domain-containing protein [Nodosilinea sp. E11]|uniref:RNA-binding S4 domain-containing protein n=1 Tax=Nodosilinea sp. E11 TaxID=3037479 RepID=UPI002934FA6F|nr:RNA-binding S4 domain-containing protein [Nodosilinea sp. E11]WOD37708.1 RNA-binding S4 domain-containing protein [Nodosilinea sp. E11]
MPSIEYIKLDQFLKQMQAVGTGGQAKLMIQDGVVRVNGDIETRRGRKLVTGDRIELEGQTWVVDLANLG